MPRCVPPPEQLELLPTPLNGGERNVLDALLRMEEGWSVFVQPRLAMAQPDFVVVHHEHGVWAIEVKDWDPKLYRSDKLTRDRRLEVYDGGKWVRRASPMKQAREYRSIIYDRFFARDDDDLNRRSRIRALLVLPQFTDAEAQSLLGDYPLVAVRGGDGVNDLSAVLQSPSHVRPRPMPACRSCGAGWTNQS